MEQWQLKQRQALPLEIKIIKSQQKIREWYDYWGGDVYVSFSGGKDSTVLLDLAREIYPNISAVYIDTGLEYPEIRDFVKTIENVTWVKPKMNFKEVIEKYGYPIISKEQSAFIDEYRNTKSEKLKNIRWNGNKSGRGKISKKWRYLVDAPFKISDKCCDYIKKQPAHIFEKETGLHPIIGEMAVESMQRETNYKKYGCNGFNAKRPISRPLGFWTDQDILLYLQQKSIPYSKIYGDIIEDENGLLKTSGEPRTGCMFCMFGVHMEKQPNKFQRMLCTHPYQWDYCMNNLGLKKVLDYIRVPYR